VRFGLVGTGHWAATAHAPALRRTPGVTLVGVWGRNRDAAAALAAQAQVVAFPDFDSLVAACDAVAFAVPPDVQAPLAQRAATAGRHLLLEKPVALSVAEADALVDAVERAGVRSLVFFKSLFQPEPWRWLDTVRRTRWTAGSARWVTSALSRPNSPYLGSLWRQRHGALWDVGPHALSLLLPALGPVTGVRALRGEGDLVHVLLAHETGATSSATLTIQAPAGFDLVDLTLWGEAGATSMPISPVGSVAALSTAIRRLVDEVEAGGPPHLGDVRFGARITAVLSRVEAALAA
jgi:Predicted dehydrogenases and related proteins